MIRRARRFAHALIRARDAITVVEFALVLGPLLILIMGSLDLGYQVYLRALATGALERAARKAALGSYTRPQIVALIRSEVGTILPNGTDASTAISVKPLSYSNFSAVGGGERITGDTAPVGVYNAGDCYEDRNNNGKYDATNGGGDNIGSADDIIFYDVDVTVPRLFPIFTMIGWGNEVTVDARTLIRNQPFGQQQVKILCS